MGASETKLWWASIGGGSCEPVRVTTDKTTFYSIGCNDPHPMTGVVLVKEIGEHQIPMSPVEAEKDRLARLREFEKARKAGNLSYRRFDRSRP